MMAFLFVRKELKFIIALFKSTLFDLPNSLDSPLLAYEFISSYLSFTGFEYSKINSCSFLRIKLLSKFQDLTLDFNLVPINHQRIFS